ncbi:hypothetical protein SAMN05660691_01098 [Rheinheimera pacifica]|uniref:Uncharacterized protein n=1 Tax=Rheinheimera pacifica TaxID=173990 RepID=A0A1H6KHX1_9GAMM|nr:hypothetical protein [Rheinheimera pacifica]SEH73219.1 hypothetical protein SAMN05660691_01098 [Rheinheimera pacifica]
MKAENIVDKQNVQLMLRQQGCQVLRVTSRKTRAVIEIQQPSPQLQKIAAAFTENVNGQQRQAFYAQVRSCVVHWHQEAQA